MRRPRWPEHVVIVCLIAAGLVAWWPGIAGLGGAMTDRAAWGDIPSADARWKILARSGGVAVLVGLLATVCALPMAQVLRRSGVRTAALLIAPVWIPSWLIYAGLNLARAPDTMFGAAFMDWALDPARAVFGESNRWAIVALGRTVAIGSLVLWSAPIAALVMAGVEEPEKDAARELARTEPMGLLRRGCMGLRWRAGAMGFAAVVVGLLTLGSAVPLHLAQVETDAIWLWRMLLERPPARWDGVWLALGPQMAIALVGAWWITGRIGAGRAGQGVGVAPEQAALGWPTRAAGWGIWALAVVVPMVLMAWSLDRVASIGRWVRLESGSIWTSAWIAGCGAVIAGVVALGVGATAASDRRAVRLIARVTTVLSIFGALVPGVFIGASIARMGLDEAAGSVMAAAARTTFVGALAGLIIARSEGVDEAASRRLDGAGDAWGWLRANRWRAPRLFGGVWLGTWVLGLYEIEASVMVRPPGRGNLPQQLLSDLHYARLESLSAGGVVLGLFGILVGVLTGLILRIGQRKPQTGNPGGTRQ